MPPMETSHAPHPHTAIAPPAFAHRNAILAVMCLALVMVVAGVSMLANGLPHLAAGLDASQSQQQWIVDAYALTLAAFLLPAGALGDRFGRRRALIIGLIVFGGASALAATAGDASALIAYRALMGIGAALIMPGTLSTITSVFPPEERAKAVGIWAGFAGTGGTLGLLASGALLEGFYWGSIFLVTAVLALAALVGVIVVVPSTKSSEHVGLDPTGSVLSAVGIGLLVLGIIEGPERGWTSALTLGALIGGVVLIATFIRFELRSKAPLLDPRLFRHRGFATGSASLFLQFFAMFGFFFVSLQFLQLVLGYSALTAAIALLPMSVVILPLSVFAGTLSERFGHKIVGGAGLAVSAAGFGIFATLGTGSGYWPFLLATIVIGAGAALAMTPATNAIVSSLPRAKQGVASAVNDTARELGAAFGVAVLGSAFNTGYRHAIASHVGNLPSAIANQVREAPAIALSVARGLRDGSVLEHAVQQAFVIGMRYALLLGMGLLVVGAIYVWFHGTSGTDEVLDEDFETGHADDPATRDAGAEDPLPVA
jgi:EmrB/QacA subfamily drug resistance transporter